MYIPKIYRWQDTPGILDFIRRYSFAMLVSSTSTGLRATHLPLDLVMDEANEPVLTGHLSRANEQSKAIDAGTEMMAIFQGPHGYISSSWYDHPNVPTWNYLAVHAYGIPLPVDRDETIRLLEAQIRKYEETVNGDMSIHKLDEDFLEAHLSGIVCFKMAITRIEAAQKMSQNRDETNKQRILHHLGQQPEAHELHDYMRAKYGRDNSGEKTEGP